MQLSDNNRNALLLTLHKIIEETAEATATAILQGVPQYITYPPNGGLSEDEEQAILQLKGNTLLMSAMRKLLANNSAEAVFSLINIIDGTTSPDVEANNWSEVLLVDKPEDFDDDVQFLHDDFYETYWNWKDKRGDKNWSLDTLE